MRHSQAIYQTAELDAAEEGLLQSEKSDGAFVLKTEPNLDRYRRSWLRLNWSWILQSVMLVCSSTLFILCWYGEPSDATCTRKLFPYSPALAAVTYHEETLLGAFLQPSPYRGTPTPEIDSRWEDIWDWGAFNIADDKIHLLNKSRSVKWHHTDPEFGGGVAALSWGFHQIHCLDLLRQMTYKEEYELAGRLPAILRVEEGLRRDHLDHCIELIRIDMMCQADVTPYFIVEASLGDAPDDLNIDFSVFKKCRDFGKIKDWMKDHVAIESVRDSQLHSHGRV
ncbi:hypothetical protein B0O99DRAFT_747327 [Bisporella sp. PMI_857]|nr:hypothetical protein B0O99DRAFT_747327 [Bisporella sp. PMI_857]